MMIIAFLVSTVSCFQNNSDGRDSFKPSPEVVQSPEKRKTSPPKISEDNKSSKKSPPILDNEAEESFNPVTAALMANIEKAQKELSLDGAKIGVSFSVPDRSLELHFNNTLSHNSASSAKWLWAAAALQTNSPASLEKYIQEVFRKSDNENAGMLIDYSGGIDRVNAFMRQLGITPQEWQLCLWNYGRPRTSTQCTVQRNVFTTAGGLKFLKKLHQGDLGLETQKITALINWGKLAPKSGLGGWLLEKLTSQSKINSSHKAGWIPAPTGRNTLNELGIIPLATGETLLIAISIEGGKSFNEAEIQLKNLIQKIVTILSES